MKMKKTVPQLVRVLFAQPAFSVPQKNGAVSVQIVAASPRKFDDGHIVDTYALENSHRPQPMYVPVQFAIPRLTTKGASKLSAIYSKELSGRALDGLELAIDRFVNVIALADKLPSPSGIKEQLEGTLKSIDAALMLRDMMISESRDQTLKSGAVEAESTVRNFLRGNTNVSSLDFSSIEKMKQVCEQAIRELAPLASRRGSKPDLAFQLLLETVTSILREEGLQLSLPSNAIKEKYAGIATTKLVEFVELLLSYTLRIGEQCVASATNLTRNERLKAIERFRSYSGKSRGALVDQLRVAKKRTTSVRDHLLAIRAMEVEERWLRVAKQRGDAEAAASKPVMKFVVGGKRHRELNG